MCRSEISKTIHGRCTVKRCFPSQSKMKWLWHSLLGHALVVLSPPNSSQMVLYELKKKVDWYLIYRCLKLISVCMLCMTCDNINYLAVCKYLRNDVQKAHVYSATQMQCKCNISFHIVVMTGSVCNITSASKTLPLTDSPHCKGEQNYGGVTLFVRTDICSVQDQMTVSAANSDSYTESNISYVTCYTPVCDVNRYGVTSNKKHAAVRKLCFLLAIKPSF